MGPRAQWHPRPRLRATPAREPGPARASSIARKIGGESNPLRFQQVRAAHDGETGVSDFLGLDVSGAAPDAEVKVLVGKIDTSRGGFEDELNAGMPRLGLHRGRWCCP